MTGRAPGGATTSQPKADDSRFPAPEGAPVEGGWLSQGSDRLIGAAEALLDAARGLAAEELDAESADARTRLMAACAELFLALVELEGG